jgi:hypothetical protein
MSEDPDWKYQSVFNRELSPLIERLAEREATWKAIVDGLLYPLKPSGEPAPIGSPAPKHPDTPSKLREQGFERMTREQVNSAWNIGIDDLEAMALRAEQGGHIRKWMIIKPRGQRQLWVLRAHDD